MHIKYHRFQSISIDRFVLTISMNDFVPLIPLHEWKMYFVTGTGRFNFVADVIRDRSRQLFWSMNNQVIGWQMKHSHTQKMNVFFFLRIEKEKN